MEPQLKFEQDGVTYVMTPCNAFRAWGALKKALKLAENISLSNTKDAKQIAVSAVTTLVANLGDPAVKDLEDIVLSHTSAQVSNDTVYRLSDRLDQHFNVYRHHLIGVLVKGVKYQFGDFLKGGGGLLNSIKKINAPTV